MNLSLNAMPQTMSSTEIAELAGKTKSNVHRDIGNMLKELYDDSEMNHQQNQGVTAIRDNRGYISEYHLDKDHTLTLITGYNVKMRHAINKRWSELEQQNLINLDPSSIQIEIISRLTEVVKGCNSEIVSLKERVTALESKPTELPKPPKLTTVKKYYSPLELGNMCMPKKTVKQVNRILENHGLQENMGVWVLTHEGKDYGSYVNVSPRAHSKRLSWSLSVMDLIAA